MDVFSEKIKNIRKPLSVQIEFTYRCNFNCDYCFEKSLRKNNQQELDVDQWKYIIDELENNGCTRMVFTGGEICIKKDIDIIYEYAWKKGFIIDLCSNISILDKVRLKDTILKYKPNKILITLYGDNEVYRKFCHTDEGWNNVTKNIVFLKENHFNVKLRSIFHKDNISSINKIKNFVEKYSIPSSIFTHIAKDCDLITNHDELNNSIEENINIYKIFNKENEIKSMFDKKIREYCLNGFQSAHIDPYGNLYLCPLLLNVSKKFNILNNNFNECWDLLYKERLNYIERKTPCFGCKNENFCKHCYASYFKDFDYDINKLKICCNRAELIKKEFGISV